jgi:hypothetical protein
MPSKFVSRPQSFCACIIVTVSGFPEQTVARQGSLVFCVGKSSEAERERMEPLERNERVCGEELDTGTHPNVKSGFNLCLSSSDGFDQLSRHLVK